MTTDLAIAQENEQHEIKPITEIAQQVGLSADDIEVYGKYKAKLSYAAMNRLQQQKQGKLVLVTSINPTPAGEGKSTVTIGLGDALNMIGKKATIALREPSLGPVMGIKGGATGGGYAQAVPMEDINLHFTGDMHALTTANDTLAALIDNHLQQGNELNIDPRRIQWKRALDINDRALRNVVIGLGGHANGIPREDGFDITVASELMAILCLADSLADMKQRIGRIVIGYTYDRKPVTVADLGVAGAITMLLKDAIKPNLVQSLAHTPTFIHGGPFANIAHGANSILATRAALGTGDIAVTEAGFGADLGGEKFMDITAPAIGHLPDAVVIVATIRALKYNGGVKLADLKTPDVAALKLGYVNLRKHIQNMQRYGRPVTVAINVFTQDSPDEIQTLQDLCAADGVKAYPTTVWADGGAGAKALAEHVAQIVNEPTDFKPLYANSDTVEDKLATIARTIYGAQDVAYTVEAKRDLRQIKRNGWTDLPICVAKTQYSLSDNAKVLGAPSGFTLHVRNLVPKTGAGFIVAMTGDILTMPGLPKHPAAMDMDVDENGKITGLF